jgi:ABC-2 type transport system permease protein
VEHALTSRPSLAARARLPRGRVVLAMIRRDLQVTRSYRLAFMLDVVFGLLNLALFFFISRTFKGVHGANLHGAPTYFAFASVGIAITIVVDAASTGLASRIRGEQLTGTLEALLIQPVTVAEVSFGLAGFPFVFAMVRAVFYMLVAALWFHLDIGRASWPGFALVLLVAGVAFSALGVLLGAAVLVIKRGDVLVGMVIFGMGLVSGALFPINVLPGWLEPLGKAMPTRFAFDGLRSAMFTGTGWWIDVGALAAYSLVGIPAAIFVFGWALRLAQRQGSLGQY